MQRVHPLAGISALAFITALVLPFASFGLRFGPRAVLGVALLGSAFAVLTAGHFRVRNTWQRNLALALVNVPLFIAWLFAVVVMWYFQPGIPGAIVLGGLVCVPAALSVVAVRRFRGGSNEHAA